MRARKITKSGLAALMHTSRTQINRVLDPNDGNVTIETLQCATAIVGRRVQLELVQRTGMMTSVSTFLRPNG